MTTLINREWMLINKTTKEAASVAELDGGGSDNAPMTFNTRKEARNEKAFFASLGEDYKVVPVMVTYEYEEGVNK